MSISAAITAATSGLRATQRRADVAANNIANAQTEGYTRKDVLLAPGVVGGLGAGVITPGIRRAADGLLARDARQEAASAGYLSTQATALTAYTNTVGQPQDEKSISSRMAALEVAFQKLADTPENGTLQRGAVDAAQGLTKSLNAASKQVGTLREDADASIEREVGLVNEALKQLTVLNKEANMRASTGQDFTEVEDQRDRLLDQIGERLPIRTVLRQPNEIVVFTDKGTTLLDGDARKLSFTRTTQIDPTLAYVPGGAAPAGFTGGLSGLTVDGQDIAPGSGDSMSLSSGTIAGHFMVRDTVMPKVQAQLDQVASALADRFQQNDASVKGTSVAGLFTDDRGRHMRYKDPVGPVDPKEPRKLEEPSKVPGMAQRIAINDAVLPEKGGYLWRIRDGVGTDSSLPDSPHPGGHDTQVHAFLKSFGDTVDFPAATDLPSSTQLSTAAREMVGLQHAARASADGKAEAQSIVAETLRTAREGATGVNTDEELQKVMEIERSYSANATVIKAASAMLDELLSIVR